MNDPTKTVRFEWMDVVRGCAALLVINFHAYAVLKIKYSDISEHIAWSTIVAEPFRMPVLMFLSGLLVHRALQKGSERYIWGKVNNIAYPYLIWTLITAGIFVLRTVVMNKPMPFTLFDAVFLGDAYHMWFLYYLFFFYLFFIPLAAMPAALILTVAVLGAVVSSGTFAAKFGYMFAFFSLGAVLGRNLGDVTDAKVWTSKWAWPLFVVLAVVAWQVTDALPDFPAKREPLYTLAGLMPIIWLSMRIANLRVALPLKYIGRNAIVVYLAHMPIAMILPLAFSWSKLDINFIYPFYFAAILATCVILVELQRIFAAFNLLFSPALLQRRLLVWVSR